MKCTVKTLLAAVALTTLVFVGCKKRVDASGVPAASEKAGIGDVSLRDSDTSKADVVIRFCYYDTATWPNIARLPLPEHAYALTFKSMVESLSNNTIAVELYPGNMLGDTKATMEMCMSGSIEMVTCTGTVSALMPELQVIFLPYVFKGDEVAWDFFDNSPMWKRMCEELEKKSGMRMISVGQNGTRHFTNNVRPIHSPKDMKGLKFRVMQSPIYVKMVEAMGASATPLASGEIYTACQTNVVDGQENPIWNIVANKWYEVQKYITLDGHTWSENFVMINSKFWNKLTPEQQRIIERAAYHAQQADRAAEDLASRVLDFDVIRQTMEVYVPTAEELKEFQDAAAPTYTWLRGQVGDAVVDEFLAEIKKSEVKYGY